MASSSDDLRENSDRSISPPRRVPKRSPKVKDDWCYWIEALSDGFEVFLRDRDGYLYWCDLTFSSYEEAKAALEGVIWRNAGGQFCNPSDWLAFTEIEEG
jgi:hypothetical protein